MILNIREVSLPNDALRLIFSYLEWEDFTVCCSVSNQWELVGNDQQFLKYKIYWKVTFNPQHWNDHFADLIHANMELKPNNYYGNIVLNDQNLKEAYESLPNDIGKLFKSPCPIFPKKKWGETHDIIWIPANVSVWKIIFLLFDKKFLKRNYIISSKIELSSSEQPTWIAMTKSPISKGKHKTILNQQTKITRLESGYHFPKVIEAIIWTYIRLIKQKRFLHNILCQENDSNDPHVLEFFSFLNRTGIAIATPYLDMRIYNSIASKKL